MPRVNEFFWMQRCEHKKTFQYIMYMLQLRYPQAQTALFLVVTPHSISGRRITGRRIKCNLNNGKSRPSSIKRAEDTDSLPLNFDAAIGDYGPSLAKGHKLYENGATDNNNTNGYLDKQTFTRVFNVAALRVSAEECYILHNRLKGHLLNWPRIQNIARVPGDDIEPHLEELFSAKDEEIVAVAKENESENAADPDLVQRARIVQKFNSRGFVHFRKLANISRPKKKKAKKKEEQGSNNKTRRIHKNNNEFAFVEVIDEDVGDDDEDLSGLLGKDYKIKKWRGPTRLLLLDERHAKKSISEIPQAVQVVLRGDGDLQGKIKPELVQCKLTLFYDYWIMHEVLQELLPKGMVVPTSFEHVGHIIHLNLKAEHLPYRHLIAQVVIDKNKPKIQTVVNKVEAIQNDYRTMKLEVLAGKKSLVTSVVENELCFHVDLGTVYWNSRLATERQRLIHSFRRGDNVCDVFSGVGPLSIAAAKKVNRVYANDLNPSAVKYQMKNIACNKVHGKVEVYNLDGRDFIKEIFGREKPVYITQVVMNLPKNAVDFLGAFRGAFKDEHMDMHLPLPTIHVYGFSKASNPESDFHESIEIALGEILSAVDIHCVRAVAPGKWMLCATFLLPRSVAFAR